MSGERLEEWIKNRAVFRDGPLVYSENRGRKTSSLFDWQSIDLKVKTVGGSCE